MKRQLLLVTAMAVALSACKEEAAKDTPMQLDTEEKRVSYGMGLGLGERIKEQPFTVDVDAFSEGIRHAIAGTAPLMTEDEIRKEMEAFQQKQMEKQKAEMDAQAEKNRLDSETFLTENKSKEGVVTTDSGLQYKVLTAGTGAKPKDSDTVEVHYRGTLIDGTEFDSSYKRNSTVTFPVNGVIPGWTEALQLMPVGSKWELYIPSDLAYGPGGTGGPIGPNQALIFEVELIAIKAPEAGG